MCIDCLKIELKVNQEKRQRAFEKYNCFIDHMIEKDEKGKNPKGIRYRKWLRVALYGGATKVFESEEEEYRFVGKFGTGMFNEDNIRRSFNKEDQKILVELADEYGAFDY